MTCKTGTVKVTATQNVDGSNQQQSAKLTWTGGDPPHERIFEWDELTQAQRDLVTAHSASGTQIEMCWVSDPGKCTKAASA